MSLPMNKWVDRVGTEIELIDFNKMAHWIFDEVNIQYSVSDRIPPDEQTISNIEHHLRIWGDCFCQIGKMDVKPPALIQPLKRIG